MTMGKRHDPDARCTMNKKQPKREALFNSRYGSYDKMVAALRSMRENIAKASLAPFKALREIRDNRWYEYGPHATFELFIVREYGMDAKRFATIENIVARFGEPFVIQNGIDTAAVLLRVVIGGEQRAQSVLQEMTDTRGGRAPSPEALLRALRLHKLITLAVPTSGKPNVVVQLQAEKQQLETTVAQLQAQNAVLQTENVSLKQENAVLKREIARLKAQMPSQFVAP